MGGNQGSLPEAHAVMTESEISALLDAHDALVKACVDSSLTFSEFLFAYGDFPNNYALDEQKATADARAVLQFSACFGSPSCHPPPRAFTNSTLAFMRRS